MSDYVQVVHRVDVKLLRRTPEVDGPRGWAEGSVERVEVERHNEGLILKMPAGDFLLRPEVVEALYDVWQEVPVGSGARIKEREVGK